MLAGYRIKNLFVEIYPSNYRLLRVQEIKKYILRRNGVGYLTSSKILIIFLRCEKDLVQAVTVAEEHLLFSVPENNPGRRIRSLIPFTQNHLFQVRLLL